MVACITLNRYNYQPQKKGTRRGAGSQSEEARPSACDDHVKAGPPRAEQRDTQSAISKSTRTEGAAAFSASITNPAKHSRPKTNVSLTGSEQLTATQRIITFPLLLTVQYAIAIFVVFCCK